MNPYRVVFRRVINGILDCQSFEVEADDINAAIRSCDPKPGYIFSWIMSNTEEERETWAKLDRDLAEMESKWLLGEQYQLKSNEQHNQD